MRHPRDNGDVSHHHDYRSARHDHHTSPINHHINLAHYDALTDVAGSSHTRGAVWAWIRLQVGCD